MRPARSLTAIVVLAGMLLAGCGQEHTAAPSSTDAAAPTGSAASTAEAVPGSTIGDRAYNSLKKNRSYRMVTQVLAGGQNQTTQYDVALGQQNPIISTTVQTSQGPVDLITDTKHSYGRSPKFGTDRWVPLSPSSKRPGVSSLAAGMNTVIAAAEPKGSADVLRSVPSFTPAGQESVNGVNTTRYTGAVPASAVTGLMPDLANLVKSSSPIQVWVDRDGAVRRVVLDLPVGSSKIRYTQNFTHQGKVQVTMPEAGEIAQ